MRWSFARKRSRRWWRRSLWVIGATLTLGGLAFVTVSWWVQRGQELSAQRRMLDIGGSLRTGLSTAIEALLAVQAYLQVPRTGGLSLAQFRAFCRSAIERYPEMAALEWFPLVSGSERAEFEAWVQREQPGFEMREPTRAGPMVKALQRAAHMPLTYSEPLLAAVQGLDLAFDEVRSAPVLRALAAGRATLSDRFQLVEDAPGVFSVVAYAPVTAATWIDPQAQIGSRYERGVVVALFRLHPLLQGALRNQDLSGLTFELWDPNAPADLSLLYRSGEPARNALQHEAHVAFVDRNYVLRVFSERPALGIAPYGAALGTMLLCLSLAAYAEARHRARRLLRAAMKLGQYQLEGRIAKGGMGTVYRAKHALLRRPTAIKIAHEDQAGSNLEKEVLLTSTLTHPNTVLVYDFGRGEDGAFYYAMEFIDGYDLEQLVQVAGALPPARVVRLLLQAAGSLAEAHDKGLVHRDIKPSNLMLTERGGMLDFVKVLDFGLAKPMATPSSKGSNASAAFAGTPGYVAPEVIAGGAATPLSDIFSLGSVAYYLLAAAGPFARANSATEALTLALTSEPAALPQHVPASLAQVVMACLARKPEQRPSSMRSLSERLKQVGAELPPWTQQDAAAWWKAHPPNSELHTTTTMQTFVPVRRGLVSSKATSSKTSAP